MRPRFHGTSLITGDVPGLCAFYARLLDYTVEGDGTFAFVRGPGAELSVFSRDGMENMVSGSMDGAGTGSFTLEFEVDDVDARYEKLRACGTPVLKPPTTQPWGRRSLWLRDPDGNIVNLYQPAQSLRGTGYRSSGNSRWWSRYSEGFGQLRSVPAQPDFAALEHVAHALVPYPLPAAALAVRPLLHQMTGPPGAHHGYLDDPLTDTPGASTAVTTPQATASIHDFAGSLG